MGELVDGPVFGPERAGCAAVVLIFKALKALTVSRFNGETPLSGSVFSGMEASDVSVGGAVVSLPLKPLDLFKRRRSLIPMRRDFFGSFGT